MGLGERMKGGADIVFDADGYPVSFDGGPVPDDETLERIRRQSEHYQRLAPSAPPGAPRARFIYKNRPAPDGG